LINVLRDRNADQRNGRDYLPAEELAKSQLEEVFTRWLGEAEEQLDRGIDYCCSLTNWRVRFATALPALIGARTIALLRTAGPAREKIKVPRRKVQLIVLAALVASVSSGALRALHARLRDRPA
jgi:farnesyl-diphosphate farnesyltransferase